MVFLSAQLAAFLKMSRSLSIKTEEEGARAGLTTLISNAVAQLSSGELAQAMEILIEAQKPIPKGDRSSIEGWLLDVIHGAGGLKAYYRKEVRTRASLDDAGKWIIRCLANPKCNGSGMVVQAILDQRALKLGLVSDDLEARLAGGLLDDNKGTKNPA